MDEADIEDGLPPPLEATHPVDGVGGVGGGSGTRLVAAGGRLERFLAKKFEWRRPPPPPLFGVPPASRNPS